MLSLNSKRCTQDIVGVKVHIIVKSEYGLILSISSLKKKKKKKKRHHQKVFAFINKSYNLNLPSTF